MKVGITQGDTNGVGLEIIIKALSPEEMTGMMTPVIFANKALVLSTMQMLKGETNFRFVSVDSAADAKEGKINLVNIGDHPVVASYGEATPEGGRAAFEALEGAVAALEEGDIDILVTAPINKSAIHSEEFDFPGHTEYLEARLTTVVETEKETGDVTGTVEETVEETVEVEASAAEKAQMILFNDELRVALLTTHLPIKEVSEHITAGAIDDAVRRFDRTLRRDFACDRPRIAVLSLNPHCGDDGLLGTEEKDVIIPALRNLQDDGVLAFGPYAADGFFGSNDWRKFDGVLAMYHDQGLAPFKALAGCTGVNFTAGLEYVRTSPDHGTAYDIAGKMKADATSMRQAIYKGIDIFRARERYDEMSADPLRIKTKN